MCGIVAISKADNDASFEIIEALLNLQHRGQESSGIMTCQDGKIYFRKKNGLVLNRYTTQNLLDLKGNVGIGHVRYSTAGYKGEGNKEALAEAQPFYISFPFGIILAYNGNILSPNRLADYLYEKDFRHISRTSDTDVLINIFSYILSNVVKDDKLPLTTKHIFDAVNQFYTLCVGGYSIVLYIIGFGLVAFRDPYGIRPLVFGHRENDHIIASESVALDILNYRLDGDIEPGEVMCIVDNKIYRKTCFSNPVSVPCIFEYIYFARQDSIINGISVYKARQNIGYKLAQKIKTMHINNIDVVMPVPDASRPAAIQIAHDLGIPYREGILKNRFTNRTFILPNNKIRNKFLKRKFNIIRSIVENKNILIVDDSIVRGNTAKHIVSMVRNSGAKNIYFASCSPPLMYQNVYGIDIPTQTELVAYHRNIDEIGKYLGVTKLIYLDIEDLIDAVRIENPHIKQFDCSVFDGKYITDSYKPGEVTCHLENLQK